MSLFTGGTTGQETLEQALGDRRSQLLNNAPAVMLKALKAMWDNILEAGLFDNIPKEEQLAPDFTLPSSNGQMITLSNLLRHGPVVLTFYRGRWCPYCNLQLRAYQTFLPRLKELGATLVAVSPQTPDNSLSTTQKLGLEFTVLSDTRNRIIKRYGLNFQVTEEVRSFMKGLGTELSEYNGDETWELPVPATFVIDPQGIVKLAYTNPDYTYRLDPARVVEILEGLKS